MIYYRGLMHCGFWEECLDGGACNRALTNFDKVVAKEKGLPISRFAEKPQCFKEKPDRKTYPLERHARIV